MNEEQPTEQQIMEAIATLKRANVEEVIERPFAWSQKSVCPYYTAKHAEIVKDHLEKFIASKEQETIIKPAGFGLSRRSLIVMFNQGLLYLQERKEEVTEEHPKGKWAWVRKHLRMNKNIMGLKVSWKKIDYVENVVETTEEAESNWMRELCEWIETAENDSVFERTVGITADEVVTVRKLLDGMTGIHLFKLSHRGIKVGKLNV